MTSCDLINNGQRGFSVETSKLEAVYFQPGFWGNLHQPLRCLAWGAPVPLPPTPSSAWKRDPRCFSTDAPILPERTEAVLRAPSLEGKAICPEGWPGWLQSALGSWGADGWENLVSSQGGQARWAQQVWAGGSTLAFPAHPLPLLLSLFKKSNKYTF